MHREIIQTRDGSHTLYVPELNEHYHSIHGAIQESRHIYIQHGIHHRDQDPLHILEAGFGTGLNAYLTLIDTTRHPRHVIYHSYEKYPLNPEEVSLLNYPAHLPFEQPGLFEKLHAADWETNVSITPHFTLHKHQADFSEVSFQEVFDIVFFDAFAPDVQPHLWSEAILSLFYTALKPGGILVTYCVKGSVKQTLRRLGFTLQRLPGPPGKHEMLRATKPA